MTVAGLRGRRGLFAKAFIVSRQRIGSIRPQPEPTVSVLAEGSAASQRRESEPGPAHLTARPPNQALHLTAAA
jgi:hypothetical protein